MINEAQVHHEYKSLNGRDILDFPLHVPMEIDISRFLKDAFNKYCQLLERVQKIKSIDINIDSIKDLCDKILDVFKLFRNGKVADAYYLFEHKMNEVYAYLPIWKMIDGDYYRMRKEKDINIVSKLYPLPPELRYLSGGMRFSIPGYTCFYVGQSKSVCKLEINDTGSMINIKPKKNAEFNLIDLTFSDDMHNGGAKELHFIQTWPLIASCYIDMFYCLSCERVCPPDGIKFNEKYIVPQFLTTFIRKNHSNINGIRYYTVKDKNLDPFGNGEKNMRNIVIYVDSTSKQSYDDFIKKFEWSEPYNV